MARIRTIKPEFWKNEGLSALPEATHLLAAALLNYADDEGYFNANPKLVQAECCPLREPSVSIHGSLTQLSNVGYLRLGTDTCGRRYGHIVHFEEHQRVNRPSPSKIKTLGIAWDDSVSPHGVLSEPSLPEGKGTGNREQGMEEGLPNGSPSESPVAIADQRPSKTTIARKMAEVWNSVCGDVLPRARGSPGKTRQQHLLARFAGELDRDMAKWELVCQRVRASKFLTGQAAARNGKEPFTASLDWVVAPTNFAKVVEGNYDDRGRGRETIAEQAARLAREHGEH